ncbi:MAG: hypothetical protein WBE92_12625 [Steroidobacteraceae bacterium]
MRANVKDTSPERALARILQALEKELVEASDEEILAAAEDLGMDPRTRGSAAFAGLKYPSQWHLADYFAFEGFGTVADFLRHDDYQSVPVSEPGPRPTRTKTKRKARRAKRSGIPRAEKDSGDS